MPPFLEDDRIRHLLVQPHRDENVGCLSACGCVGWTVGDCHLVPQGEIERLRVHAFEAKRENVVRHMGLIADDVGGDPLESLSAPRRSSPHAICRAGWSRTATAAESPKLAIKGRAEFPGAGPAPARC